MQRFKPYFHAFVWQAGLGYLALWAVTYWTLAVGTEVFGNSGACQPDAAKVLFYWACAPDRPLALMAAISNFALTVTVWAPVYVAAATVRTEAVMIALPIAFAHLVGLPAAMFVFVRATLKAFDAARRVALHARTVWAAS
jgi:hypothetical protein